MAPVRSPALQTVPLHVPAYSIHASNATTSRRRGRRRVCSPCGGLLLLLLSWISHCQAQQQQDNTTTSAEGNTNLNLNLNLTEGSIAPTIAPQTAAPSVSTPQPPVLPPTTSYFGITALYSMVFVYNGTVADATLTEEEMGRFQDGMQDLTKLFAPEQAAFVVSICDFIWQGAWFDLAELSPPDILNSTIEPPGIPPPPLPGNSNNNRRLSFNWSIPEHNPRQHKRRHQQLREQQLRQQRQRHTSLTSLPSEAIQALKRQHRSHNHTRTIEIRQTQQHQELQRFLQISTTNNTTTSADVELLDPNVTRTRAFEYIFEMTYLSTTVNVSNYPERFQSYISNNVAIMSNTLELLLQLPDTANLEVTYIDEIVELVPPPTIFTVAPTPLPTESTQPSSSPSVSPSPTTSPQPSTQPSLQPSDPPSYAPSFAPSFFPTYSYNITANQNFLFDFTMQGARGAGYPNETEQQDFCQAMENQTGVFAPESEGRVITVCTFDTAIFTEAKVALTPAPTPAPTEAPTISPQPTISAAPTATPQPTSPPTATANTRRHRQLLAFPLWSYLRRPARKLQLEVPAFTTIYTYTYTFRMRYQSDSLNCSDYPDRFADHVEVNGTLLNDELADLLGLTANNNVTIKGIRPFETLSESPTFSLMPSFAPTQAPTILITPLPTYHPTALPTGPPPTPFPSTAPSLAPSSQPSPAPEEGGTDTTLVIVVTLVALIASAVLLGMAWFYKTRRRTKLRQEEALTHSNRGADGGSGVNSARTKATKESSKSTVMLPNAAHTAATSPMSHMAGVGGLMPIGHYPNSTGAQHPALMSPSTSESILSNPSLLSNGQDDDDDAVGAGDDDDDDDMLGRHSKLSPLDDFDRFKDHNLEKMRSGVQTSVVGMDGMMSQALTMTMLEGGAPADLLWQGAQDGIEIEANALCEVTDWMKRKDMHNSTLAASISSGSFEERQSYMQDMLNRMVTTVRQGLVGPDEASRIIHECAALLNLELANNLPITTIILSGMRKTVKANDVIRAFRRFGPIEDAAVASGQRGFGIVRFVNPKTIQQVMLKFRTEEIVVQDVAVQVKCLAPLP